MIFSNWQFNSGYAPAFDLVFDLVFDVVFDLDLPPRREAERRFRGVGRPAWMPGELRSGQGWPVAACPRSGTGEREPERSEGRTQGRKHFGYFAAFAK